MSDILSVLIYLCTFLIGFFLKDSKGQGRKQEIKIYVFWLFVFLCFSYMNGADWRGYELDYNSGGQDYQDRDYGYYYVVQFFRFFFKDFWITFALLKCVYLWSCIKLLKLITPEWVTSLAIMIPTMLLFMLINSPFRFMIAMTFINGAFYFTFKNKYIYALVFCVLSIPVHSAAIFTILFVPFIKYHPFNRINKWILIAFYVLLVVVSSNLNNVLFVQVLMDTFFRENGMRSFNAYFAEDTASLFTLGIFLQFVFFVVIVFTRDKLAKGIPNGEMISNMAVFSCLVWRMVSVMPTASRVVYPLELFYSIYFVYLTKRSRLWKILIVGYFCLLMTKNLYDSFVYLPYTNSIPYIVFGHKPYAERSNYNLKAYKARTGETIHLQIDDN